MLTYQALIEPRSKFYRNGDEPDSQYSESTHVSQKVGLEGFNHKIKMFSLNLLEYNRFLYLSRKEHKA